MFRQCPSPNRFDMDGSSEMCVINFFFMLPKVYGTFIVNGSFIVLAVGLRGLLWFFYKGKKHVY